MTPLGPIWDGYFNSDELDDLQQAVRTTTVLVAGETLCVRVYEQDGDVPTVLIAHGLLGYGPVFARFHLPFWRHGWRVVQFDLPGCGASSGPRGSLTVPDIMAAWQGMTRWATETYGAPLFVAGNAEDGVVAYYALANDPAIAALSVHTLFEYGDPAGAGWIRPPWLVRVVRVALGVVARNRPQTTLPGTWTIPWKHVFAGPDDKDFRRRLAADPLALQRGAAPLGYSLLKRFRPPVRFEDCTTPVQVIISTHSRLWPAAALRRSAARLGGPRDIVEFDAPHWEMSRAFHDAYCERVIAWFEGVCAMSQDAMATGLGASENDGKTE